MKKLLCVLMFGMVFGQAELTTRVYDYIISMQQDEFLDFTLSNITNGDLDNSQNAFIRVLNIYDCTITSAWNIDLKIKYEGNGIEHERFLSELYAYTIFSDENLAYFISQEIEYFGDFTHQLKCELGHVSATLQLSVTAEFPEEDTGYIEEGFDYCIEEGANLVASPCRDEIDIIDTLPSEIANNLTGIIGQGVAATNEDGTWMGSLNGLGGGNGYWFQSNVSACFNYNCAEN